ncbi:hypothetical protein Tco_0384764 [Tanacetum coccineum]
MVVAMKHIVANYFKLHKFKGVDFRIWKKKMHFLLSTLSVMYVLTTPMPEEEENAIVEQIRKMNKWENDDYVCRGIILNGCRIVTSQRTTMVLVLYLSMVEHNNSTRYNDNKGNRKHQVNTKADPNKKSKLTC